MRGSPLFQTILIAAVFLLAAVPVWRLTRPAAAIASLVPSETPAPAAMTTPLEVEAVFAPAPADFQIKSLGQTILEGHGPQARFTTRWTAVVPPEGVDLVVQASWPAPDGGVPTADPGAARVTVRFPDGRTVEKSFWSTHATLADVFTVPGTTPAAATP